VGRAFFVGTTPNPDVSGSLKGTLQHLLNEQMGLKGKLQKALKRTIGHECVPLEGLQGGLSQTSS